MPRLTADEYRNTMICIDSAEGGVLQGCIRNPYLSGSIPFGSVMQLLIEMENLLDSMQLPQAVHIKREFSPEPGGLPAVLTDSQPASGKLATFAVRVMFRRNASWQGSITWLEGNRQESFRSVLELLLLMNSALASGQEK